MSSSDINVLSSSEIPAVSTNTAGENEEHPRRNNEKERRRRERRERRARRQFQRSGLVQVEGDRRRRNPAPPSPYGNMPDILNSHALPPPPPYSTLPPPSSQRNNNNPGPPNNNTNNHSRPPPLPHPRRWRTPHSFPAAVTADLTRSHFYEDNHHHHHPDSSTNHLSKSCCGVSISQTVSIRWFIIMIAFVGICCSVVGTVLGALKASGREHLTVSLLMIGVGIVLITVSGIAWRLTSNEGPSCRSMLGLNNEEDEEYNGRFLTRPSGGSNAVPYNGRPQHPYAAMMYSDFQYRPPPPTYQASMQEYRLRLLLMDRQHSSNHPNTPVSPPPNYCRSQSSSRFVFDSSQFSRPPSYRSHSSDQNLSVIQEGSSQSNNPTGQQQPTLISTNPIVHRRQNSFGGISLAPPTSAIEAEPSREDTSVKSVSVENVLNVITGGFHQSESKTSPKTADSNLVTIVQTSESFALSNNNTNSLIVTVSGSLERSASSSSSSSTVSGPNPSIRTGSGEVEILAHL